MKEKYRITLASKVLIIQFILCILGLMLGYFWGVNEEIRTWSNLIYSNIKVENIDVGGKNKTEAMDIINSQYIDKILNNKVYVTFNQRIYSINNSQLVITPDFEDVVEKAYQFGKNYSLFKKHSLINRGAKENYTIPIALNKDFLNEFVTAIEKEINTAPQDSTIDINEDGQIKITPDTKGYTLEKQKLIDQISDKLGAIPNKDLYIEAPTNIQEATIKKEMLSTINTCLSTFSTTFETSSYMRSNNIDISAKAINSKVLLPGESFSFNDIVGERTPDRGYMEAPVIFGNKIESGIGGGICQVSSTLYNTVLRAGINSIQRQNHTLPTNYVDIGLDATVDWGNIDFKFENTLEYPMYLQSYTKDRTLYVKIFSNSSLSKKVYTLETNVNNSPYLPNDVESVKVVRKTFENGQLVNIETISDSIYLSSNSIDKKTQ